MVLADLISKFRWIMGGAGTKGTCFPPNREGQASLTATAGIDALAEKPFLFQETKCAAWIDFC